jgi:hypothetical protein
MNVVPRRDGGGGGSKCHEWPSQLLRKRPRRFSDARESCPRASDAARALRRLQHGVQRRALRSRDAENSVDRSPLALHAHRLCPRVARPELNQSYPQVESGSVTEQSATRLRLGKGPLEAWPFRRRRGSKLAAKFPLPAARTRLRWPAFGLRGRRSGGRFRAGRPSDDR